MKRVPFISKLTHTFAWQHSFSVDEVAEWLRRWTANPMCSARVGSNPILVEGFFIFNEYVGKKFGSESIFDQFTRDFELMQGQKYVHEL